MAFLTQDSLKKLGFRSLGRDVKISDRAAIHDADQIEIGDFSRVDDFCVLSGRLILGRNVHVAVFCNLAGGEPGISIGDFSGLAYGCHLFSQSDDYTGATMTNPTVPKQYKMERKEPVNIGRHCILGTGTIVFAGVTLPDGVSSGASTVFTKSAQAWTIYTGSPARLLRRRKNDLLALEKEYLSGQQLTPPR